MKKIKNLEIMETKKDYSKMTDNELLSIVDPNINKGGIPLLAVMEAQKRNLKKMTKKTVTS
jgi:hypothetical protein